MKRFCKKNENEKKIIRKKNQQKIIRSAKCVCVCVCVGGGVLWKFQLDLLQTNSVPFNGIAVTLVRSILNNPKSH